MITIVKQEKGQSLVEFALLIPIMLLLVIGTAEFGRAWMTRNILTGAAREAVRAAAVETQANAYNSAQAIADNVLASASIPITFAADGIFDDSVNTPVPRVSVIITYNYSPIIAGLIPGLPASFPLRGTATMRRERY